MRTAVQAKSWKAGQKVRSPVVRQFRDALIKHKCSQGVIITTSGFSRDAKEVVNEPGHLPVILIDGMRLVELAIENKVGVDVQSLDAYFVNEEFFEDLSSEKEKSD